MVFGLIIPCSFIYIHFVIISMQQTMFYGHISRSRRKPTHKHVRRPQMTEIDNLTS